MYVYVCAYIYKYIHIYIYIYYVYTYVHRSIISDLIRQLVVEFVEILHRKERDCQMAGCFCCFAYDRTWSVLGRLSADVVRRCESCT